MARYDEKTWATGVIGEHTRLISDENHGSSPWLPTMIWGVVMGLRMILARSLSEGSIPFTSTKI